MPGVVTLENVLQIIGVSIGPIGVILVLLIIWCIKVSGKVGELNKDIERLGRVEDDIRRNRELINKVKEDVDRRVVLDARTFQAEVPQALTFVDELSKVEEGEVIRVAEYRKKRGRDAWHWCRNCSNWPTSDFDTRSSRPSSGELCNECKSKDKLGTCRT